jgi:hypothetical protein
MSYVQAATAWYFAPGSVRDFVLDQALAWGAFFAVWAVVVVAQ